VTEVNEPPQLAAGEDAAQGPAVQQAAVSTRKGRSVPELAALISFFVAEVIFFSLKSPYFWHPLSSSGWDNWLNILTAVAVAGIIAAPATLLLVAGQFDLSVGSGTAFTGVMLAYMVAGHGFGTGYGVVLVLLVGLGIGVINGFFVTVIGVNALITTLGMLAVLRGLGKVVSGGQTLILPTFSGLGTSRPFWNIPTPVLILVGIFIVFWFMMRYTVFGRSMYAIGANPIAARLTGIRSKRLIFAGFLLSGLCTALGGLILTSQLGAASPVASLGLELSVVTAVILGGASLAGGRGTILGTILGLLIIGVLNNGLILLNIDPFWQEVAQGTLLIAAVSFDQLRIRLTSR
jgi:ribose transport system permease protein